MLMPSIFGENLFDDWMDFPLSRMYGNRANGNVNGIMRTDIRETADGFELDVDLPGFRKEDLKLELGKDRRIVRAMPNTPAMIGEGMTGLCCNREEFSDLELNVLEKLFSACGRVEFIDEKLMDAVVCASGSSPAFAYLFIEALADGAVRCGMPRNQAYIFAAQAVKGAASMVLETGEHPGLLKDRVCSPAGTTIEGEAALEEYGLRNAVLKGAEAVLKKCREM